MKLLKKIFNKDNRSIENYNDFWSWFEENQKHFFQVVKKGNNINKNFFSKLSPKLSELKEGFWFLAGMFDEETAELILTADGVVKNIIFVEELVAAAPKMNNWKITALKPPSNSNQFAIEMDGYQFNEETMSFYAIEHETMPDEIEINIVHTDLNDRNKKTINIGVFLALDNSIGELNSVSIIDVVNVIGVNEAEKELIPITKLKDFLIWREKEFIEKYEEVRYNTENDEYLSLESKLISGLPLLGVVNKSLLYWDSKASHPWVVSVKIKYDGRKTNGLPNEDDYQLLDKIEDDIMLELKDSDGYLNVGRETGESLREIFFACKDFRKPSKVMHAIEKKFLDNSRVDFTFEIYKDKYWQTFNRFLSN